jgi:hypothetical protein
VLLLLAAAAAAAAVVRAAAAAVVVMVPVRAQTTLAGQDIDLQRRRNAAACMQQVEHTT